MKSARQPVAAGRWPFRRIADLFDIQLGKMLSEKARTGNSPFPYVRNVDVQWGRIRTSNLPVMNFDAREAAKFELIPGDVLVCEGGEPGRAAVWRGAKERCFYQKALHRLRRRTKDILPEFYIAWARVAFRKHGVHDFRGAKTTIAHLPAVKLAELTMPQPPIEEQRAIAAILSNIEKTIDVQTCIVATLKELKAATMAKLFREGIRGEGLRQTEIGEIPIGWRLIELASVCALFSGVTPPKAESANWSGPVPWLSPKDMKRPFLNDTIDHISEAAAAQYSKIAPAKTVFVVVRGMVLAKDFPVAVSSVPMAFNQDMKALVASPALDPNFLHYTLLARKAAIRTEIGSSAHGTRRLGTSSLDRLQIPLPEHEEQQSIAMIFEEIDRAIEAAASRETTLLELFDSTLEAIMSGAVQVCDGAVPTGPGAAL